MLLRDPFHKDVERVASERRGLPPLASIEIAAGEKHVAFGPGVCFEHEAQRRHQAAQAHGERTGTVFGAAQDVGRGMTRLIGGCRDAIEPLKAIGLL